MSSAHRSAALRIATPVAKLKADCRRLLAPSKRKSHPGNRVAFSFQGRIVLTEGKVRQNFLAKSYESKKGGVKEILDNKCFCFQHFTKAANSSAKRIILRSLRPSAALKAIY
jgi:hypothetical protein